MARRPALLDRTDLAAAAIGDAGLGDLVVEDAVVGANIERPHDAGDVEDPDLVVDAHLLRSGDHQVSIRKDLGHNGSDGKMELLRAIDRIRKTGRSSRWADYRLYPRRLFEL